MICVGTDRRKNYARYKIERADQTVEKKGDHMTINNKCQAFVAKRKKWIGAQLVLLSLVVKFRKQCKLEPRC